MELVLGIQPAGNCDITWAPCAMRGGVGMRLKREGGLLIWRLFVDRAFEVVAYPDDLSDYSELAE